MQERTHRISGLLWRIRNTQRRIDDSLAEIRQAWDMGCLLTTPSVSVKPEWVEKYEKAARTADLLRQLNEAKYHYVHYVLTKDGWEVEEV